MKSYVMRRAPAEIKPHGDPTAEPWRSLPALQIASFPWYRKGRKQGTEVKACYTARRLHLLFQCEDRHISASRTALNSAVYRDSCVEFFGSLPADPENYFNLEMNCCGALLMGYGPDRPNRRAVGEALASRICICHSVPGPPKADSPDDDGWVLQVALPFAVLSEFARCEAKVAAGTRWRANFYRCGGATDPQHACWSPICTPAPDFHQPACFGLLVFGG